MKNNENLAYIMIVGIVAVIGILVLVMGGLTNNAVTSVHKNNDLNNNFAGEAFKSKGVTSMPRNDIGICQGDTTCNSLPSNQCSTNGCSWIQEGDCIGGTKCVDLSQQDCQSSSHCNWQDSSYCSGNSFSCSDKTTINSCNSISGCDWCGDNVKQSSEECDDGNSNNGDGCSSTCELEGITCNGQQMPSCNSYTSSSSCNSNDGCTWDTDGVCTGGSGCVGYPNAGSCNANSQCSWVNLDACTGEPSCCGNDVLQEGEQCDDGNVNSGDGCSATCENEGITCYGQPLSPCSDHTTSNSCNSNEGCTWNTDGVCIGGSGCIILEDPNSCNANSQCTWTNLDTCTGEPSCCGNGQVQTGEQCDDGDRTSGDGCSATCEIENNCLGNQVNCNSMTQDSCGTVGCTWSQTYGCTGPNQCNNLVTSACLKNELCTWEATGGYCSGTSNCEDLNTNICELALPDCYLSSPQPEFEKSKKIANFN